MPNSEDDEAGRDVTRLMQAASQGDQLAASKLFPLVYEELRRNAAAQMRGERSDHTLSATALVNEAYLKLVQGIEVPWPGRLEFYASAVQAMRRILVDHARARGAQKRGGARDRVPFDEAQGEADPADFDAETFEAIDQAIEEFQEVDPRGAMVVRLRFFTGVDFPSMSRMLGVSESTLDRDWRVARRWLSRRLAAFVGGEGGRS